MNLEDMLKNSDLTKRVMKKMMFLISFVIVFGYAIFHFTGVIELIRQGLTIISPFLAGLVVAFVLNVLVKLFEERVFAALNRKNNKIWNKCRRAVCILISFILILLLLTFVIFLIVPELVSSVQKLAVSAPGYINEAQKWILGVVKSLNIPEDAAAQIQSMIMQMDWQKVIGGVTSITTGLLSSLVTLTMSVTSGAVSFFMSLIFAIYMLAGKEKLIKNLKRLLYAFLPAKNAQKSIEIGAIANRIFANFVAGQCTEALIIGCLCYLGMSIIQLPYALLVSTVIAVTSVIPIFGAYIGAIFGGFILLIINPLDCLIFVIYIVLLQNLEGNIIYPRVVGTSVGLPGIWVMLSIFVFGDLFGFVGMLIGVPTCSVLYALLRSATAKKLINKGITDREVLANQLGLPPDLPKTELEKQK